MSNNKLQVRGAISEVFQTKQVSERFTKREFTLQIEDGKYSQLVLFEVTGDRISMLDGLVAGEAVDVTFNLRGREWRSPSGEVKYFNSLSAWKVEPVAMQPANAPSSSTPDTRAATSGGYGGAPPSDEGDIPFASCDVAFEPSPIARLLR